MEKESKTYEINYLFTPLIPAEKIADCILELRKTIESNNSLVVAEEQAKIQRLSYPVKKFETAYFGWFRFTSSADSLEKIKNTLEKNQNIIRFLAIESSKENLPQFSPRRFAVAKKQETGSEELKVEIKPEQIDQKLKEILKEPSI